MSSNLPINKQIEKYIDEHSLKLHPVQDEIIKYNDTLGKKKKLQISINQCHFLYLVTKLFKPKEILEIGTFTGLSSLSMCIGLENDAKITTLDKNKETSLVAKNFFEKAKVSARRRSRAPPIGATRSRATSGACGGDSNDCRAQVPGPQPGPGSGPAAAPILRECI